ncbi:MAG: SGNH/GDSL hydrolase family protein [Deltaproteobacteria bacterium]|nr:SGNH/GDSL hydrolase family protein [Deltaproteobacteria bacterium]
MAMATDRFILALLADERVDDEVLAEHFELDETTLPSPLAEGQPHTAATPPPAHATIPDALRSIPNLSTAAEGILGGYNRRARLRRQKQFAKRARGFSGVTLVTEGDSWFQFPTTRQDVIDHLFERDDFNPYSLGYAGDWLSNIVRHHEYYNAIHHYRPQVFLLSGGGNDMLGKGRLKWLLHPFAAGRAPEDYFGASMQRALDDLERLYRFVFDELTHNFPELLIVGHGYDYGTPDNGRWLGKPMATIGIHDPQLQRAIVHALMDRFNAMRIRVASDYDRVVHVDIRGRVDDWGDELHPTSKGFAVVASAFDRAIRANL